MLSPKLLTSGILSLIATATATPIETTRTVNRTGLCGRQGDKMLALKLELPGPACAFTATVSSHTSYMSLSLVLLLTY